MENRDQWTSRLGFIFAAAGSAIGLGAIWKFPYVAGTSGGGVFLLIFILFTVLVGLPLLLGEFIIGRTTQKDAIESFKELAPNSSWHLIGRLGMVTCFILLSFYSVVGGWIILYIIKGITGGLSGLTNEQYQEVFGQTISDPLISISGHLIFMLITIFVVSKGISEGIEKANKIMIPGLFILLLIVILRSVTLDGSHVGIEFFFKPDISNMTSETLLFAMGQSFFTLSVGVSVMITYSSYVSKKESLPASAISIVIMNIFVALLAGLAIFPAVFSFGLQPDQGPVLIFNVLPFVFDQIPFGIIFLIAFFILFLFAALTSAFSMLEIIVAVFSKGDKTKRMKFSWIIGLLIFLVGIPSGLSFGVLSDITLFDKIIFDNADYLVSNILMPLGALLISIFIPLKISKERLLEEISSGSSIGKKIFASWYLLLKYLVPIAIIIVYLDLIGII